MNDDSWETEYSDTMFPLVYLIQLVDIFKNQIIV